MKTKRVTPTGAGGIVGHAAPVGFPVVVPGLPLPMLPNNGGTS
ncbi:hypothetical protein [Halovulum marinum]|nr:hypothetical protein [Halovulum marinum]